MRRIALIVLALVSLLILTSCFNMIEDWGDDESLANLGSEKHIARIKFEQILEAIENKDDEAIKSLFSEKALHEAEDLDGSIEALYSLIEGDVVSWEQEGWGSDQSTRSGKRSRCIRSWFILETTEDSYRFFLLDYDENRIEPSNEGVYAIRAIRAIDEDIYFMAWQDMEIPGVYIPEEYSQSSPDSTA